MRDISKEEPKSDNEKKDNKIESASEIEPKEVEKKEQDSSELKEQLLRLAAEFDNYKKKVKKDIEYSEKLGKIALIKDLLPVIDEFELAMLAISDSNDNIAKGIEMLYSNFIDVLKKEGLGVVEVDGIFDPYKHEIIMVRESDKEDGTILEIVKKGYIFGDKLLRPASVIIAKNREKEEKKNEKTE